MNGYMSDADKAACDNDIAEWIYVGGAGYRLGLPNAAWQPDEDEPPFKVYSLDPRQTFIVHSNGVDRCVLR